MCGICGIVDFSGERIYKKVLTEMVDTLQHRGPDDCGVEVSGSCGLGHTRLSIIDLSEAGHQPMVSKCERYTIVYNGEVYNFPELRELLINQGVKFRSYCDTEVVLQAYMIWGRDCFVKFNGMFALGIWDAEKEELLLARDRFGIKPLYFYRFPFGVVFGSEIKAMLASHYVPRNINWEALHEYLYYGYVLDSKSLFEGVERLRPGTFLTINRQGIQRIQYWSSYNLTIQKCDCQEAIYNVREKFRRAVSCHLISDVPVGVFLSGGIDSSAITAIATKEYGQKLRTFSVGFDWEGGTNELPKARLVAEHFGTEHHELQIKARAVTSVIEALVRCHDEPFADAANIPLFMLCEQLRGEMKVILQGDGGDEIFAGYRRYNVLAHERFWRIASKIHPIISALPFRGEKYHRVLRQLGTMVPSDPAMRMAFLMTCEVCEFPPTRALAPDVRKETESSNPFNEYHSIYSRLAHLDPVQRMLYSDCMTKLPNDFLEKVDRATMAHSIEVRVPFLDSNLTDYVMRLPANVKVKGNRKKWILRQALQGIVPKVILNGRKTGFNVPYEYWLRVPLADYMRSTILNCSTRNGHFFDREHVTRCINEHTSGRRNHGPLLYKLLNLALWHEMYMN